jgi:menaquinone-dependent protoporphyrinogen IX oxidase
LAPESDRADGSGPSMIGEDTHHIAARIAQKLRDAGFKCVIVNLVPVETARYRTAPTK